MPASIANSTSPSARRNVPAVTPSSGWNATIARPCNATNARKVSGATRAPSIWRRCSLLLANDMSAAGRQHCFGTTRLNRWFRPIRASAA